MFIARKAFANSRGLDAIDCAHSGHLSPYWRLIPVDHWADGTECRPYRHLFAQANFERDHPFFGKDGC